jgi:hypothetical protein
MLKAYSQQMMSIPAETVDEVARQLQFDELRPVAGPLHIFAEVEIPLSAAAPPVAHVEAAHAPAVLIPAAVADFAAASPKHSPEIRSFMEELEFDAEKSPESSASFSVAKNPAEIDKRKAPHLIAIDGKAKGKATRENRYAQSSAELMRQSVILGKQSVALGKQLWKNFSSSLSSSIHEAHRELSALARSRGWERELRSLLNWLQQPMSTAAIKAHRKVDS